MTRTATTSSVAGGHPVLITEVSIGLADPD